MHLAGWKCKYPIRWKIYHCSSLLTELPQLRSFTLQRSEIPTLTLKKLTLQSTSIDQLFRPDSSFWSIGNCEGRIMQLQECSFLLADEMCMSLVYIENTVLSSLWRFPIRRFLLCWWRIELHFCWFAWQRNWFACISTNSVSSTGGYELRKSVQWLSVVILLNWYFYQLENWLTMKAVLFDMDGAMEV